MKKTSNGILVNLSSSQIEILTKEVKETIALETGLTVNKTFTAANLWNIQRQVGNRSYRRFF